LSLDRVNRVNFARRSSGLQKKDAKSKMPKAKCPKNKMGVGIAAGPHCRRCWHSHFPASELTAYARSSKPHGPGSRWCRCRKVCVAALPAAACVVLDPSRAPLPSAWPQSPASGRDPRGDKGPVAFPCRFLPRPLLPCPAFSLWSRSLCRISLASGRRFSIRNRSFQSASPPPPERASARWKWLQYKLSCPA